MTTTKKHYSSLGHQFNGIFHELFNSFEEAQDFAESIGSEVHLYWRRYGERCWNDEGIHHRPIEMKTDDPDVMWYERAEGARAILQSEGGFEEWFDGCVSAPPQSRNRRQRPHRDTNAGKFCRRGAERNRRPRQHRSRSCQQRNLRHNRAPPYPRRIRQPHLDTRGSRQALKEI